MNLRVSFYFFIMLCSLLASCTHGVYVQRDEQGTSKYTLFKDQFKYEEDIGFGKLKVWGAFEIKDNTIIFEYDGETRIPYNYHSAKIEKLQKSEDSEACILTILDEVNEEPLPMASVAFYDELDNLIGYSDADYKGLAKIYKNEQVSFVEVAYPGFGTLKFDYADFVGHDLVVRMERFIAGARSNPGSCFDVYQEAILEYAIDDSLDITEIKRNEVIFKKKTKGAPLEFYSN